jgi:hypothetical protein
MKITKIFVQQKMEEEFSVVYYPFKDFQHNLENKPYWDKCMEAAMDMKLLGHIKFCNDLFKIPPVKTFLLFYQNDFIKITGHDNALLTPQQKKSIGAFWGMMFKYVLGYQEQKNVSVSMNQYFMVKTATFYSHPKEPINIV